MGRKNSIEGQLNLFDMWAAVDVAPEEKNEDKEKSKSKAEKVAIHPGDFVECVACWCATCEHSTVGGSVPRPFGEDARPCPSCELCVGEGEADICVIGSAEEGCRYRAEKEGLVE